MQKKILVYGDSNTWGWVGITEAYPSTRYGDEERWAGVMASALEGEFRVSVDGLTVRSTDLDDSMDWNSITADMFNGARLLPCAIAREMPVDLVIIALGTNDLKAETGRSAKDIAEAIMSLADLTATTTAGVAYHYQAPQVLLIAPAPLAELPHADFAAMFAGGQAKSAALGAELTKLANARDVACLDAGAVVGTTAGVDGLHLSKNQHQKLGVAIAEKVKSLQL